MEPVRGTSAPLDIIATSLRRERDRAGLSLTELARRAGVAKSTLSQLEAGQGNPSVETLWALCAALGIPFSQVVAPAAPSVRVVRAGEGPSVRSEQIDYTARLLASCPPNARRDIYVVTAEPGAPREAQAHVPGTLEHLIVSQGRLRTGPADCPEELATGDYIAFPGDVPHVYEAIDEPCWFVLVMEHV